MCTITTLDIPLPAATLLCRVCTSIDFDKALCSPEFGGTPLQTFKSLENEAVAGCELCLAIRDKSKEGQEKPADNDMVFTCVWNWYEGQQEDYRGSAVILFFQRTSKWCIEMGVCIDEGI